MLKLFETEAGAIRLVLGGAKGLQPLMCTERSLYCWNDTHWEDIGYQLSLDPSRENVVVVPYVCAVARYPEDSRSLVLACQDGVFARQGGAGDWLRVGLPPGGQGDRGSFVDPTNGEMRCIPPVNTLSLCWYRIDRPDGISYQALFAGCDRDLYFLSYSGYWNLFELKAAVGGGWSEQTETLATIQGADDEWLLVGSKGGLCFIGHDLSRIPLKPFEGFSTVVSMGYRSSDSTIYAVGQINQQIAIVSFHFPNGLTKQALMIDQGEIVFKIIPSPSNVSVSLAGKVTFDSFENLVLAHLGNVFVWKEQEQTWTFIPDLSDGIYSAATNVDFNGEEMLCLGTTNGNLLVLEKFSANWKLKIEGLLAQGPERISSSAESSIWGIQHVRVHDPQCSPSFAPDEIANHVKALFAGVVLEQPKVVSSACIALLRDIYQRWLAQSNWVPPWAEGVANCHALFAILPDNFKVTKIVFQTRKGNGDWNNVTLEEIQADPNRRFTLPWSGWSTSPILVEIPGLNEPLQTLGYVFKSWTPDINYCARFSVIYEIE